MTIPNTFRRDMPVPLVVLLALVLGPAPVIVLAMRYPVQGSHVTSTPEYLGLLLGGAYGVVMIMLSMRVRCSSDTRVWFGVVILLGILLTGPSLIGIVNTHFDQSTPMYYTAQVLKLSPKGKYSAQITVTHWEADAPPFDTSGSLLPGTELPLIVHQGRLGFPWIEWAEDLPYHFTLDQKRSMVFHSAHFVNGYGAR